MPRTLDAVLFVNTSNHDERGARLSCGGCQANNPEMSRDLTVLMKNETVGVLDLRCCQQLDSGKPCEKMNALRSITAGVEEPCRGLMESSYHE